MMKQYCREILRSAYLYLDGEVLTQEQRVEFEVHLQECAPCYERVGLDREITVLISRLRSSNACPDRVKDRIRSMLDEA